MSNQIVNSNESVENADLRRTGAESKKLQWFELALVLVIAVGGSFLSSLYMYLSSPNSAPPSSDLRWVSGIVHEIAALLLLGYVLSRRGCRLRDLGLRWSWRDALVGIVVAAVSYATYVGVYGPIHSLGHAIFLSAPSGLTAKQVFGRPTLLFFIYSLVNPFFEELIVRAYVMTEVAKLTGSWIAAALVSVVIQSSYHLYYGWEVLLTFSFQFLIFAIYYALARRALPIIVAHGIFDVIGILQLF